MVQISSPEKNILIVLEIMDLDLALKDDSPLLITNQSTSDEKRDK